MTELKHHEKLSAASLLITLGIIYGDIGTSPLYVVRAIIAETGADRAIILGGMSCVFWTLLLITTFKYIFLALKADNNGEGGIFALYGLVKHHPAKWTVIAALIGCAALISDGFITPPISISSAVEGLNVFFPQLPTLPVVVTILIVLFAFQQFGTSVVGKTFGPVMLAWFSIIAILGINQILLNPDILNAVNPIYAFNLLTKHPHGFWILGAVFLCTTGGEALYADLGHCGKPNIRITWVFVLSCLLLNYFGQCAWALSHADTAVKVESIFYAIVPTQILPFMILLATVAAVIASQALISGCFTLVSEAIKQRLWINLKINYPADLKGQIYIPAMNWFLFFGCLMIVLIFQRSANMEAIYGLAIIIDMLMTSCLLLLFFHLQNVSKPLLYLMGAVFFSTELAFLMSNLKKFFYGGWVTFFIGTLFFVLLFSLRKARQIRDSFYKFANLDDLKPMFTSLMNDESIPKEATNLVFLSKRSTHRKPQIDSNILYSIFQNKPRRANVYWFVHIDILDYPHEHEKHYSVKTIIPDKVFFVRLEFGFKVQHKANRLFRKVVEDMAKHKEVDPLSHYPSMREHNIPADFKFIFVKPKISEDNDLKGFDKIVMTIYDFLTWLSYPPHKDFGLDVSNMEVEVIPLDYHLSADLDVKRRYNPFDWKS